MTYTQKMFYSIISAVLIGGILISMLRIDNKVGFGILVGTVTYILYGVSLRLPQPSRTTSPGCAAPDSGPLPALCAA